MWILYSMSRGCKIFKALKPLTLLGLIDTNGGTKWDKLYIYKEWQSLGNYFCQPFDRPVVGAGGQKVYAHSSRGCLAILVPTD